MSELIDAALVAELRDLMGSDLETLLAAFRADARARLANLGAAANERDLARLKSEAHSLKGSAANVGAATLAVACASLESVVRDGDSARIGPALEVVDEVLAATIAAMDRPPYRDA